MRFSYWPSAQYPNRLAAAGACATDQFSRGSRYDCTMETAPLAFLPQRDRHDEDRDGDNFKSRKRPLVAHLPPQQEQHRIGWCGDENPKLIRETGDQPPRFIR